MKGVRMPRRIILCLVIFTLVGCSLERQIERRIIAHKETDQKCDLLLSDSRLDILRAKTKVTQRVYTLTMLTDSSFPSDEEIAAIPLWIEREEQCRVLQREFLAAWHGENAANQTLIYDSKELPLIAQLYNREVTWLYFNTRHKEMGESLRAELQAIMRANDAENLRQREASAAAWAAGMMALGEGMQGYSNSIQQGAANRAAVVNSQYQERAKRAPIYTEPTRTNCDVTPGGRSMSCVTQ